MYRPPSSPPATIWARHLDQARRERGLSQTQMFEIVAADLGYGPKSRSAFLPFLAEKEPDESEAPILAKHFGWPQAEPAEPIIAEPPEDLAAAISALTVELRTWRTERESLEARLRAVEAELGSLREAPAAEASQVQSVPRRRAG